MKENGYRVNLPIFEGPLDLLLSLIERDELDITRISLAQVADQYLAYMEQIDETRPEMLADFLVVAAKLVLIKSQALLPRPPAATREGTQDVGEELVNQLKLYKQFKEAASRLKERQEQGLRTFVRLAPPPKIDAPLDLSEVTLADLLTSVREALQVAPPAPPVDQIVSRRQVTVRGQIDLIRRRLQSSRRVVFQEMLASASSRVEIAVTLLATLELIKRHEVSVIQEVLFGPIIIEPKAAALDKPA